jgi:hypothetical protein
LRILRRKICVLGVVIAYTVHAVRTFKTQII